MRRRLLRAAGWLMAVAILGVLSVSQVLKSGYGAAQLTQRLAASFGRPVEVGSFDVSVLGGLRLEANQVTVAEDPRFGHEYFLRAERLTAGIRWTSLLSGRVEFDSLTLTRPSLNLVRTAEGQWNLENWLPWPAGGPPSSASPSSIPGLRPLAVNVTAGRINFKRGFDKHPFALVRVEGSIRPAGNNEWDIDVEARPMRAGVVLQEPGTLRVRGRLGGAANRLRPASLQVSWIEASLSDALRLATASDHGVRGEVSLDGRVSAPAPDELADGPAGSRWSVSGVLRVEGVHRWDLPPRDTDPAWNLNVVADWWPALARVELSRADLEGLASSIRGSGFVQWGQRPARYHGNTPQTSDLPDSNLRLVSSGISLNDLFRWYPAFRADVSPEIVAEGNAGLDAQVRGWPLRVERVVMATDGARLRAPGLNDGVGLTATVLRYERGRGRVEAGPATILFGRAGVAPKALLRWQATVEPSSAWRVESSLAGQAEDVGPVFQLAAALNLGRTQQWVRSGWNLGGPAELRLRWLGALFPLTARPEGSIRLRTATLNASFLNAPVQLGDARIELTGNERRVALQNVRAVGTTWSGTLRSHDGGLWQIALAADSMDVATLRASLLPPEQNRSLLQRLVPGRNPPRLLDAFRGLEASGELTVRRVRLAPLELERVRGSIAFQVADTWRLDLSAAQADFFRGRVAGQFAARGPDGTGGSAPAYRADLQFRGVDLTELTTGTPRIRRLFSGQVDGDINLTAAGPDRESLLASLAGAGNIEVRNGRTLLLDLAASQSAGVASRGTTSLYRASGRFQLAERQLEVQDLQLFSSPVRPSSPEWRVSGKVALGSSDPITLDLQLARVDAATAALRSATGEFRLIGPLTAPEFRVAQSTSPSP